MILPRRAPKQRRREPALAAVTYDDEIDCMAPCPCDDFARRLTGTNVASDGKLALFRDAVPQQAELVLRCLRNRNHRWIGIVFMPKILSDVLLVGI